MNKTEAWAEVRKIRLMWAKASVEEDLAEKTLIAMQERIITLRKLLEKTKDFAESLPEENT